MSNDKIIQAVRIYLDTVETENTALGIFTASGTSEIRLSEEPLLGVALPWTYGLIAKNGIGDRSASGDLSLGGSPANYDGTEIELINTNQYLLNLAAVGVYLPGLKCEIWEFRGTESDNDATSAGVVATYVVEDISGDEERLSIPLKNGTYKRNAQMLKAINTVDYPNASDDLIGKMVPASFGKLYPVTSNGVFTSQVIAKFIRTENDYDETQINNDTLAGGNADTVQFPIVDYLMDGTGLMVIGYQFRVDGQGGPAPSADGIYVIVTEGDGSGQIRKVKTFVADEDYGLYSFLIDPLFKTTLSKLDDDTRSWVQFVKINRTYSADFWPCKSFLESTTGSETTDFEKELFTYGDRFIQFSQFALKISSTDNNKLDIQGSQYSDNIDNIDSFKILPITSLAKETSANLNNWYHPNMLTGFNKLIDGIYASSPAPDAGNFSNTDLTNAASAYDLNSTTYAEFSPTLAVDAGTNYVKVLKFGLPKIPKEIEIDKIYFGIKMFSKHPESLGFLENNSISIMFQRFINSKSTDRLLANKNQRDAEMSASGLTMDDLPDFYYTDEPDTLSANFYFDSETSNSVFKRSGYALFEMSGCTRLIYNTYRQGAIFFDRKMPTAVPWDDILKIYQIAIIVKLDTQSISKDVFAPLSGRIFNDTWGARKYAANLITLPNDMLEHCKRLQNWSETGEIGIDWGKEYATSALIKTGDVEGSYDRITTLTDQTPAFQLDDESEGYTDSLIQRLDEVYDLCTYIDKDGYECVEDMELHNPTETITEADLADDPGTLQEARSEDVYCEPVVNYQYNAGSGEYDKSLRVFNIQGYADGGAWTASSSGFANQTDAESVLDIYAALWRKFRTVEKCPSNFSDVRFFVTYADALSYIIRKGNRMGRARQPLSVNYEKGYDYNVYKHVQLNLAQVTNGNDVECMIEKLRISKRDNRVDLTLVLLEQVTL